MKVFLQDTISKRYYAAPQRWVEGRTAALDFGKIDFAVKAYTEETAHFAQIVLDDGELPETASRAPRRSQSKSDVLPRARPPR